MKAFLNTQEFNCCIIGTWDPPLKEFEPLFQELITYCKANLLNPVVVIIDPNPSIFHAENYYRDFYDIHSRIAWLNSLGIFNTVILEFSKSDLDENATKFFEVIQKVIKLKELWLGGLQSFGTGENGSQFEIERECNERGITLRKLEKTLKVKVARAKLYKSFVNMDLDSAYSIINKLPSINRIKNKSINFFNGKYKVSVSKRPFASDGIKSEVEIIDGKLLINEEVDGEWITILGKKD